MKNSDSPAFPEKDSSFQINGLTKREWLAGLAMQGLLASPSAIMNKEGNATLKCTPEIVCSRALEYADELLKQLQ